MREQVGLSLTEAAALHRVDKTAISELPCPGPRRERRELGGSRAVEDPADVIAEIRKIHVDAEVEAGL
ncbi:hypothetical protein [Streptomyces sp. NPDC050287]|uniref:hypothetical protein n=1 Tax=Streptomyces sp. NPDC050287 TaxID=3365608 RepID=UPI0037AA32DC